MKMELNIIEDLTLEAFAEKHNLIMQVGERLPSDMPNRFTENDRYYAQFKDCEVKEGSIIKSSYGNGSTIDEAISDYAENISTKRLVFGAYTDNRTEITAPRLRNNATPSPATE